MESKPRRIIFSLRREASALPSGLLFKTVVLPSTIPFILTGLRLGLGRAIVGVMVGELYAATAGIGFMITVAGATFPDR